MASTDSCLASPMKPQVLTTMTSASSGAATTWCPAPVVWPSMTSVSTRFFGHPRETKWTFIAATKPASLAAQPADRVGESPTLWKGQDVAGAVFSDEAVEVAAHVVAARH